MKAETRSFYVVAVQKAVEHIAGSLDRALDLETLACAAALSPFHFHRVFRGMVGETPLAMHRRLRMERAARTLRDADDPVTDIAFAAGYETHESFTRAFRTHYGCAPSELRRQRVDGDCARAFQIELAAHSGIHFQPGGHAVPAIELKGGTVMNVEIKEMPSLRVATVEHRGPYNRISQAFARLGERAAAANLFGPEAMMLGIYHDDPETVPAAELRSEAAMVVSADAVIPEDLGEQVLAAGRYAWMTHVGPYEKLGDTWARLMGEWLPQSGHRIGDGVAYEIYRNTPGEVPDEKLETELYVPLA